MKVFYTLCCVIFFSMKCFAVTCFVWDATNDDYGHVGMYTGRYYISLWPNGDVREVGHKRVLEEGMEGCIHYHPAVDRSYEHEREPTKYVVKNICERRINYIYEDMLYYNDITPDNVTFEEGVNKLELYKESNSIDHIPQTPLIRSKWSHQGDIDNPYDFYRRNQSCVTAVLSCLQVGDDIVNISFDSIISHHTSEQRRLFNADSFLGAIVRKFAPVRVDRVNSLVSIPSFIGILGEWNNRSDAPQVDITCLEKRSWRWPGEMRASQLEREERVCSINPDGFRTYLSRLPRVPNSDVIPQDFAWSEGIANNGVRKWVFGQPGSQLEQFSWVRHQGKDGINIGVRHDIMGGRLVGRAFVIPDIAMRHEEVYIRFLNGRLIYGLSSEKKIKLPIKDLANPLEGTFDLSRCGWQCLSISTGYRKAKNPKNANKVEIWLAPRFLIERDLASTAAHFQPIMNDWDAAAAPVGVFWNWGGDDLGKFNYLTTNSFEQLSDNKNLYDKWSGAGNGIYEIAVELKRGWPTVTETQCYRVSFVN